jgi:hypothetical protein
MRQPISATNFLRQLYLGESADLVYVGGVSDVCFEKGHASGRVRVGNRNSIFRRSFRLRELHNVTGVDFPDPISDVVAIKRLTCRIRRVSDRAAAESTTFDLRWKVATARSRSACTPMPILRPRR